MEFQREYATSWKQVIRNPTGIRGRARQLFRDIALRALGAVQPSCNGRFLKALFCHYVFDDQRAAFETMIQALTQLGTFVNTNTCIDMVTGKQEIDGRYFHLSFDDGFRNVATNAVPILSKYNIPAIVFVPTAFVGGNWSTSRQLCMKRARYKAPIETVRWSDLERMVSLGFEVGSHTKSHARFSAISADPALLLDEIAGSKQQIEQELGVECKYIAWPYGTRVDSDRASLSMVKEAGYGACFGGFRGSIVPSKTNVYCVPRHHFEVQWPLSHIKYFLYNSGRYPE